MSDKFQAQLEKGIELFNRQDFYEAHEAWEEAWVDDVSEDRLLLQGLIQVAAGFYKLQTGQPVGTMKLLGAALVKLRPFVGRSRGVDLGALLPEVERWLREAETLVEQKRALYDPALLPRLAYQRPAKPPLDI